MSEDCRSRRLTEWGLLGCRITFQICWVRTQRFPTGVMCALCRFRPPIARVVLCCCCCCCCPRCLPCFSVHVLSRALPLLRFALRAQCLHETGVRSILPRAAVICAHARRTAAPGRPNSSRVPVRSDSWSAHEYSSTSCRHRSGLSNSLPITFLPRHRTAHTNNRITFRVVTLQYPLLSRR